MSGEARDLDVNAVTVGARLREVDRAEVQKIANSFAEVGQITPIEVREDASGDCVLVAGAHRLDAAKLLGWLTIRAVVIDCSDAEARLREIDENLYRHELSPYDQAEFLAERRPLFEKLHGPIKAGRPVEPGSRRNKGKAAPISEGRSFYADVAEKFGLSREVVKRGWRRKRLIRPDVWKRLRGSAIGKSGQELDLLGKQSPDLQAEIAEEAISRGSSVREAVARRRPVVTSVDKARRLWRAVERLDAAGRKAFLEFQRAARRTGEGES